MIVAQKRVLKFWKKYKKYIFKIVYSTIRPDDQSITHFKLTVIVYAIGIFTSGLLESINLIYFHQFPI